MISKKYPAFKQLLNSIDLIKKNPVKIVYPILIDMLFLLFYGVFSKIITDRIAYYFSSVYELMFNNTEVFKTNFLTKGFFSAIFNVPGADVYIKKSLLWVFILVVFIYASYCFFQALSWRFSLNLTKKKKIKEYMKRFFLINLVWLFFFIVYNIISLVIGFKKQIVSRYAEVPSFSVTLFIFAVVVSYFVLISYSLIEKYDVKSSLKKTFIAGVKRPKQILLMYLIIFAVFYIVNFIMSYFGNINQKISIFIGVFILLPLFAWARLYIYLVVDRTAKAKA